MSNNNLVNLVKQWITLDNEIKTLQREQKTRREQKKEVSEQLMEFMRDNEIDTFDLKDGNLRYKKRNVTKPISAKLLNSVVYNFFEGNEEKASELTNRIHESREKSTREIIERKINKPTTPD